MKSMADLLDLLFPIICPPSWAFLEKTYRAATAILLLCLTLFETTVANSMPAVLYRAGLPPKTATVLCADTGG